MWPGDDVGIGAFSYPKAAALYKKILKIKPDDEPSQLKLGEISAKQGLLVDAGARFSPAP